MNKKTSTFGNIFQTAKSANLSQHTDILLALCIACILFVLLFPVNVFFIDVLLAISISLSVMILMTSLFIEKPLDLSAFPMILLVTALMRLALNIASTRLILSNGHSGHSAAGHVIEAFGSFVMGGNIVIGLIVFAIITIINFIVITKGSGRIAEVAARFSLDAMPGKQMAIDADLSAGLIDEETAKTRRKELEDESTFYGSMDGANKFVRGDAVAGLLITVINLVGGIIIGMVQKGLTFNTALTSYTLLTIGDGIVSQIPALIVSLAAGLLVSKSGVRGSADKAIFGQFAKFPMAMFMTSGVMCFMAIMPGLPAFQFLIIAAGAAALGKYATIMEKQAPIKEQQQKAKQEQQAKEAQENKEESAAKSLHLDVISLELGYNLLSLVNHYKGQKLTDQIKSLRKQLAKDLGFIIPSVRIHDNLQLANDQYQIKIKDIEVASGNVQNDKYLVMNPVSDEINLIGEETTEPAFGLKAMWVDENQKDQAIFKNYTVIDPPTVIITHLTEIIKDNITELLSYSETQKLIDEIDEAHKKLIEDTIPDKVAIGTLQRILQALLAENISIRDLPLIIEAAAEGTANSKNIMLITETVRSRLNRQISHNNTSSDGFIDVIMLSHTWEQKFFEALQPKNDGNELAMPPSAIQEFMAMSKKVLDKLAMEGKTPAILVAPNIRFFVRQIIARQNSATSVLSHNEIHPKAKIRTIGQI